MKRNKDHLVAKSGENKNKGHEQGDFAHLLLRENCLDRGVVQAAGHTVNPAHAVDHRTRRNAAVDKIFKGRLAGTTVMRQEPGQNIRDQGSLITALLITQFIGVPFAFLFGHLAGRIGPKPALFGGLAVYAGITVLGYS